MSLRPFIIPLAAVFVLLCFMSGCGHESEIRQPVAANEEVEFNHDHPKLAEVLTCATNGEGGVDYIWIQNNPDELKNYLTLMGSVPRRQYDSWSEPKQLGFLINAYNAATLKLVAEHYPISSIRGIGGVRSVWRLKVVSLFGVKMSLKYLVDQIIRKEFQKPAIHFALVCGSKGCPVL